MGIVVASIVVCAVSAFFSAKLAEAKGYNYGSWFAAGFFFSLLAILVMVGMPAKQIDESLTTTNRKLKNKITIGLSIAGIVLFVVVGVVLNSEFKNEAHITTLSLTELKHELGEITDRECANQIMQELRRYSDADTLLWQKYGHAHRYSNK